MADKPDPCGPLGRWWRGFVVAPLRRADDEARAYLATGASRGFDGKTVTVLLTTALVLTVQYYLCQAREFPETMRLLRRLGLPTPADDYPTTRRAELTHWAIGCSLLYFVIPALVIRLGFRQRLADYGLKLRGAFADGWVYVVMFAVVGPLVLLVSYDPHFQSTYPFYRLSRGERLWPDFWRWEALYALQFLTLEFFFRGFLVHGLKHRFGAYAIPVMTVPYCMIHFAKPLPETLASVVAGLALGFMSLRTRSVLLGAAIHVTVALSMDFASLWRQGFFP
jgi:membrane protease YdiL (CAAX protease family)